MLLAPQSLAPNITFIPRERGFVAGDEMLQPASTEPFSTSVFLLLGSLISGTGLLPRPQNLPMLSLQPQTLKSLKKKDRFFQEFALDYGSGGAKT